MIHTLLAGMTRMPEWELAKFEAEEMSKAIAGVARHYPAFQASEKINDWLSFAMCAGMIYGTRLYATARMRSGHTARVVNAAETQPNTPAATADQQMTKVKIPGVGEVEVPSGGWRQ